MGYFSYRTQIVLFMLFGLSVQATVSYTEEQKINHLIAYIASLHDARFIRNDSEHSAVEAAEHLQMKREKAGKRIKTANEFIENIASKSSISGKPYQIKFANGKVFDCELVLKLEMNRLMEGKTGLRTYTPKR